MCHVYSPRLIWLIEAFRSQRDSGIYIFRAGKFDFDVRFDPSMVPTYTMGFRVTTVDHMCLCSHGLSLFHLKLTSVGNSRSKHSKTTAAEKHVVPHGDPGPCGFGGLHVELVLPV